MAFGRSKDVRCLVMLIAAKESLYVQGSRTVLVQRKGLNDRVGALQGYVRQRFHDILVGRPINLLVACRRAILTLFADIH